MDKDYLLELLNKYEKGKLTEEENRLLISYYDLFQTEPDILDSMSDNKKNEMKHQMYEAIHRVRTDQEKQDRPLIVLDRRKVVISVAAAAVILVVISVALLMNGESTKKEQVIARQIVPKKNNRFFSLPDGSTVMLTADSKLNYPSTFDGLSKREVYLEGQAYFDIRHDNSKPFAVHTGKLTTTVLGTAFTIKAWPGKTDIIVSVSRGKVKVTDPEKTVAILTRHQQVTYNKTNANFFQNMTTDTVSFFDWENHDLFFDDLTLADAASLLEKRYSVKISINDPSIRSNRFTTTFRGNESLEQVLNSICVFNETSYNYNKEKATVTIGIQ